MMSDLQSNLYQRHIFAGLRSQDGIVKWSTSFSNYLGNNDEVICTTTVLSAVHSDDSDTVRDMIARNVFDNRSVFRLTRRDGSLRLIALWEEIDESASSSIWLVDYTDDAGPSDGTLHLAVRNSQIEENEAETLFSMSEDGMIVLDLQGNIVRSNSAAERIMRFSGQKLSKPVWDVITYIKQSDLYIQYLNVITTKKTINQERYIPEIRHWLRYSFRHLGSTILLCVRPCDEVYENRILYLDLMSRYSSSLKFGRITVWELDNKQDEVRYSDPSEPNGVSVTTLTKFLESVRREDAAALVNAKQAAVSDGLSFDLEISRKSESGKPKFFRVRGGADTSPGRSDRLRGVLIELSDPQMTLRGEASGSRSHGGQLLRAARGALAWSVRELSEKSGVSVATISRFEAGSQAVTMRDSKVAALQNVLTEHGVNFFLDPEGCPAISFGHPVKGKGPAVASATPSRSLRFAGV